MGERGEGDRNYTYELQEMELVEGTQKDSAVGLDGISAPSSTSSIIAAKKLKGVKKQILVKIFIRASRGKDLRATGSRVLIGFLQPH